MPEKYRPSNGTEGDSFIADWCAQCELDAQQKTKNGRCDILGRSNLFGIDHPEYPTEWTTKDGRPTCAAFVPIGEPLPYRCDKTIDMFEKADR